MTGVGFSNVTVVVPTHNDPVGRRVGEPDLLVAAAGAGRPTSPCSWPSRTPLPLHAGPGLPLHSGPELPAAGDGVVESKAQAARQCGTQGSPGAR
jgi:hypothetical protein